MNINIKKNGVLSDVQKRRWGYETDLMFTIHYSEQETEKTSKHKYFASYTN